MGGMQLRTAALVGLLGLGLGWALGGGLQPSPDSDPRQGRARSGPRPLGVPPTADVSPLTEQLRLKLDKQPRAPRPARNPFVFEARRAPVGPQPSRPLEAQADRASTAEAEIAAPRPGAQFQLSGMATTRGPDGPELTAMVHDGRALVFVKRGDTLPGGFEVVEIQESSVTLRDSAGGERTLRLR